MLATLHDFWDAMPMPLRIIMFAAFVGVSVIGLQRATGQPPLRADGPFPVPAQEALPFLKPLGSVGDFEFWATDHYVVEAQILSRKRYRFGTEAPISPVDLLLGWGDVPTESVVHQIRWSQGGRWGEWRWKGEPPVPVREIELSVANTHIVPDPSQPSLRRALLRLRRGDAVRLEGYLIEVHGRDGFRWISSRTRTDVGDGACEIVFVTNMSKLN